MMHRLLNKYIHIIHYFELRFKMFLNNSQKKKVFKMKKKNYSFNRFKNPLKMRKIKK